MSGIGVNIYEQPAHVPRTFTDEELERLWPEAPNDPPPTSSTFLAAAADPYSLVNSDGVLFTLAFELQRLDIGSIALIRTLKTIAPTRLRLSAFVLLARRCAEARKAFDMKVAYLQAAGDRNRAASQQARTIGTGEPVAAIGTPDPRTIIEGPPPLPANPLDPLDPLYNSDPGTNNVTFSSPVGSANLWKHDRANLLTNARAQDAPFVVGVVLSGMVSALSPDDVAFLNQHFGITS